MNNVEKKIEAIFNKAFPGAAITPSVNHITLEVNEPNLIGLSVRSADFEFAPEGECMSISLSAENNGIPINDFEGLVENTEIELDEGKLRIHDMPILSVNDFKRVLRQNYC
ncbi:hypothetical protein P7F88_20470 [Vibrio hannami]|uniref:hypothetical protein n=1 Tax=Vibrio hannami TaxID=2717094 RepID=UPI00240ED420|nr:hypothetical protein [Vibrio hannami]MDG3088315.1 hypothetical protein [Vibrio hannami]